ncbi:hypothetical protein N7499_008330 [Penicillium canescens]|uniref:DUF7703 domain-containing protein n=1 Tax=Penicillium canescens TaxID=5083 RepID=A0AAD6HZW2_PENCN|nr:hypothetical protein N7460_013407 [Penicillium canescens]KAJ6025726.1 hypothetical protein N7444_013405 [Penicillium canescens]KAJ6076349.1 hypothetical protein N7499_008330 [Penicillium canescens]
MAGENGPLDVSLSLAMVIAALFALACWNVLQIMVAIFTTFRRCQGLYFWSMLISTLGILLHTITSFLRYFALAPNFPMCVLICIGWYGMVTGQSVVLYSRLHLVTCVDRYSRWVLGMIVFNFCALHVPTTVLFLGLNHGIHSFYNPFDIYERVQLAGFAIQETIISGLYIWETMTNLRPVLALKGTRGKRVITNLIVVNAIAILLDASLLSTEYTNHFDVQTTYKPVVYSIKLLLEFTVLNSLLVVIRTSPSTIEDAQKLHEDGNLRLEAQWSDNGSGNVAPLGFGADDSDHGYRQTSSRDSPLKEHRSRESCRSQDDSV